MRYKNTRRQPQREEHRVSQEEKRRTTIGSSIPNERQRGGEGLESPNQAAREKEKNKKHLYATRGRTNGNAQHGFSTSPPGGVPV